MPSIVVAILLVGCAPRAAEKRAEKPAPVQAAPPTQSAVQVAIHPPRAQGRFRWEAEVDGLATALVESGLSELPSVVAHVDTVPTSPGLSSTLRTGEQPWVASLEVGENPSLLAFRLELCDPSGRCTAQQAGGSRDEVVAPVAELLVWAADRLGRPPTVAILDAWQGPVSPDPYAVLVCGRSAATFYGILPPVPAEKIGDKAADPIAKAVFLDPGMGLAEWILGRREAARGEWTSARVAFTGATLSRPGSAPFLADEAAALVEAGKPEGALLTWTSLAEAWPGDPRFQLPLARTALAAEQAKVADKVVRELSPAFLDEPPVVELAVRVADAIGPAGNYDELLARWADAAPHEAEPVRRRINLRIHADRLEEAWQMLPELANRGATDESARLQMAVGVGIGRWKEASDAARRVGENDMADRIDARAALARAPDLVPAAIGAAGDPYVRVSAGRIRLATGDPAGALADADATLASSPWFPEGLALEADALAALGRPEDADAARRRLAWSDPAF
jgi:tetratricopeptide (TPR) repeat protein